MSDPVLKATIQSVGGPLGRLEIITCDRPGGAVQLNIIPTDGAANLTVVERASFLIAIQALFEDADDTCALSRVLREIRRERARQELLLIEGKIKFNCADPAQDLGKRFTVLAEEFGEVSIEACRIVADGRLRYGALRTELIQLAAVATALAESLTE